MADSSSQRKNCPLSGWRRSGCLVNSREWSFPSEVCEGEVSYWISWGIVATLFLTSPLSIQTSYAILLHVYCQNSLVNLYTLTGPRNKKHHARRDQKASSANLILKPATVTQLWVKIQESRQHFWWLRNPTVDMKYCEECTPSQQKTNFSHQHFCSVDMGVFTKQPIYCPNFCMGRMSDFFVHLDNPT